MSASRRCMILLSNFETAVPFGISDHDVVAATRRHELADGFCGWSCHMRGDQDMPEPLDGEGLMFAFWPNNPYYERRAAQRGVSVEEYVRLRLDQIAQFQKRLGDLFIWCAGWETFTSSLWSEADGKPPRFATPEEGFDFYRRWLTTSDNTRHWRNSTKFGDARFNRRPSVLAWLDENRVPRKDFNLAVGDVHASRAHHAFDAVPELAAYWWECCITTVGIQVGIPFVRGAARQYGKRWIADVSPFSYPYPLHEERFYKDLGEWGGFEQGKAGHCRLNFPKYTEDMVRLAGYSPEMLLRAWLTAYMGGCDILFQEASSVSHFVKVGGELRLTPVGEAARDLARFHRRVEDRGRPCAPVALLLDRFHGVEPHLSPKPWEFMELTPAARQISAFFETAYPGHSLYPEPFPWKNAWEYGEMLRAGFDYRPHERRVLCPGRWPDIFDVTLTNAAPSAFADARVILALGPHDPRRVDAPALRTLVEEGRDLVCAAGCGLDLPFLPRTGGVVADPRGATLDPATGAREFEAAYHLHAVEPDPAWRTVLCSERNEPVLLVRETGKGRIWFLTVACGLDADGRLSSVVTRLLDRLFAPLLPFEVKGAPVQWSVNRTPGGFLVTLINHAPQSWWGEVTWRGAQADSVRERWKEQPALWRIVDGSTSVRIGIPPYEPRVLEFRTVER